MNKLAIAIALAVTFLAACAPSTNVVASKEYIPPYQVAMPTGLDDPQIAYYTHQDCWSVSVLDVFGAEERWCVSEEDFQNIEIDQEWVEPKSARRADLMRIPEEGKPVLHR